MSLNFENTFICSSLEERHTFLFVWIITVHYYKAIIDRFLHVKKCQVNEIKLA